VGQLTEQDVVFIETTSPNLYDKMDANYLHPERINTMLELKDYAEKGIIELKKLDYLVNIKKNKLRDLKNKKYLCVEMKDVSADYGLIEPRMVDIEDAGTSIVECNGGNILFSGIRPYLNKIVILPENIDTAICSGEFFVFSPKNLDANSMGYLWLVLRSEFVLNQTRHLVGGSLRPRIDSDDIADLTIPILKDRDLRLDLSQTASTANNRHYLAFQKYYENEANFLNEVGLPVASEVPDLFFSCSDQPSDSPRTFYRMDPLFYFPHYYELLKKELNQWSKITDNNVKTLNSLCAPDGMGRWKAQINDKIGKIPRLGVENITGHGISWDSDYVETKSLTSKSIIKKEDILISSTGVGSIGRVDIYTENLPACADGHVTIIRPDSFADPYYVVAYLNTEYGKRQIARLIRGSSGSIELYADDLRGFLKTHPRATRFIKSL
jgi:type I restriction enzyme, S subunit